MKPVPFFELHTQHARLKPAFEKAFSGVLERSEFILGGELERFEKAFASFIGTRYAVGLNSGLDALSIALRSLGVGPGDEVIVPANSFIATALAVTSVGALPVFVDADPDHLLIDPASVKKALTRRTKAVLPVHLYGQPAPMKPLLALCKKNGLFLVEDACQAHGAAIGGKKCGAFGNAGCFSFYPGKNLGALGDGGMITTDDGTVYRQAMLLRNYGSVVKYRHEVPGVNTRLDSLQAAFLNVKLPHLAGWNEKRNRLAARYLAKLAGVAGVRTLKNRPGNYCVWHLFVVRAERRDELQAYLKDRGIGTSIHYPAPIHELAAYRDLPKKGGALKVSHEQAGQILSLPMYPEMALASVDRVCAAIGDFYGK